MGAVISGTAGMANTRNYHAHYGLVNKSGERVMLVVLPGPGQMLKF